MLVFVDSTRHVAVCSVRANIGTGTPTRVGGGVTAGVGARRGFGWASTGDTILDYKGIAALEQIQHLVAYGK
jgi:hypothetical protein